MQNEKEVKVRCFKCKCGKARLLAVITDKGFTRLQKKEHRQLVDAGCDVETISLAQAREMKLCFDCKL